MSITGSNNPFACEPVVFANANSIVSLGTITRDGNQFTFSVGFVWKINGVTYQNTAPVVITITEASTGFQRIDNALLNTSNTIELQQGLESDTIALQPIAPPTAIILTSFDIDGDVIDEPEVPVTGSQFKQKNESRKFSAVLSGTDQVIEFRTAGHQHYEISGTVTSVVGFGKTLLLASPSAEIPYAGKDIFFENNSGHDITLKDNFSGVDIKFDLGTDLVVPANGIVWLKYDATAETLALFFKSWTDLSHKADLVGGKVPASQLPSYVDDVIEGYFNGTNFYTDAGFTNLITPESGKIYLNIAVTPATQYRWSGSAYVQIGGGDTYNPSFWLVDKLVKVVSTNFVNAAINSGNFFGGSSPNTASFKTMLGVGIMSGTNANGGGRYKIEPANVIRPTAGLSFYSCFNLANTTRDNVIKIGFFNTNDNVTPVTDGFWLQINGVNATLNSANGGVNSQSSLSPLTTTYMECLVEYISSTEVKCKVKETLTGNVVFNQTLTTNIPTTAKTFSCGLIATIITAGASQTICSIQELSFGIKPNFLNNF